MTIFYPAPAPVKSPRPFAAGILPPAQPARPFEPTPEERAWWAAECERLENALLDRMAEESAYLDRHEAGLGF